MLVPTPTQAVSFLKNFRFLLRDILTNGLLFQEGPNIELGLQERHEVREKYVAKLDCGSLPQMDQRAPEL